MCFRMTTIQYRLWCGSVNEISDWLIIEEPSTVGFKLIDYRTEILINSDSGELFQLIKNKSGKIWIQHSNNVYEIDILSSNISVEDEFANLISLKELGNERLKANDFPEALRLYSQAISSLESDYQRRTDRDLEKLVIPLYLNQAHVFLKLCEWDKATTAASKVLEIAPNNVKALFRRACARLEQRDFGMAKRDLLSAQYIEFQNEEVRLKLKEVEKLERSVRVSPTTRTTQTVLMEISINHKSAGTLKFHLYDDVPKTVENFILLMKKYEKCKFFKIIRNQFAQSGDYKFNDGSGGDCLVACDTEIRGRRFFKDENLNFIHDKIGLLGMANYGPNTNQSQFYITLGAPLTHLDGKHVLFAELVEGEEILENINKLASDPLKSPFPEIDVVIDSINIV